MTSLARTARMLDATTRAPQDDGIAPFQAPTLKRYFSEPDYAAAYDADEQSWRDRTNALIDDGMRRAREKRERGL